MSISKYNAEGYLDLTAYEALLAIEREGKKRHSARWCSSARRWQATLSIIWSRQGAIAGLP